MKWNEIFDVHFAATLFVDSKLKEQKSKRYVKSPLTKLQKHIRNRNKSARRRRKENRKK